VLANEENHYTVENAFAILAIAGPVNRYTEAMARLIAAAPEL
jgi:hypothetical protein